MIPPNGGPQCSKKCADEFLVPIISQTLPSVEVGGKGRKMSINIAPESSTTCEGSHPSCHSFTSLLDMESPHATSGLPPGALMKPLDGVRHGNGIPNNNAYKLTLQGNNSLPPTSLVVGKDNDDKVVPLSSSYEIEVLKKEEEHKINNCTQHVVVFSSNSSSLEDSKSSLSSGLEIEGGTSSEEERVKMVSPTHGLGPHHVFSFTSSYVSCGNDPNTCSGKLSPVSRNESNINNESPRVPKHKDGDGVKKLLEHNERVESGAVSITTTLIQKKSKSSPSSSCCSPSNSPRRGNRKELWQKPALKMVARDLMSDSSREEGATVREREDEMRMVEDDIIITVARPRSRPETTTRTRTSPITTIVLGRPGPLIRGGGGGGDNEREGGEPSEKKRQKQHTLVNEHEHNEHGVGVGMRERRASNSNSKSKSKSKSASAAHELASSQRRPSRKVRYLILSQSQTLFRKNDVIPETLQKIQNEMLAECSASSTARIDSNSTPLHQPEIVVTSPSRPGSDSPTFMQSFMGWLPSTEAFTTPTSLSVNDDPSSGQMLDVCDFDAFDDKSNDDDDDEEYNTGDSREDAMEHQDDDHKPSRSSDSGFLPTFSLAGRVKGECTSTTHLDSTSTSRVGMQEEVHTTSREIQSWSQSAHGQEEVRGNGEEDVQHHELSRHELEPSEKMKDQEDPWFEVGESTGRIRQMESFSDIRLSQRRRRPSFRKSGTSPSSSSKASSSDDSESGSLGESDSWWYDSEEDGWAVYSEAPNEVHKNDVVQVWIHGMVHRMAEEKKQHQIHQQNLNTPNNNHKSNTSKREEGPPQINILPPITNTIAAETPDHDTNTIAAAGADHDADHDTNAIAAAAVADHETKINTKGERPPDEGNNNPLVVQQQTRHNKASRSQKKNPKWIQKK